jgi:hypothetical protein
MGGYSEQQVWVAELVGTTVFTFIGLGGIANAVLPGTKGHGIGFLGIAFCFGLGVFLPLQFIGHISGTKPQQFLSSLQCFLNSPCIILSSDSCLFDRCRVQIETGST